MEKIEKRSQMEYIFYFFQKYQFFASKIYLLKVVNYCLLQLFHTGNELTLNFNILLLIKAIHSPLNNSSPSPVPFKAYD